MLEKTLEKIGFKEKEIEIYLIILKIKKILPGDISKLTDIKRPTVYSVVKELIKKGLISSETIKNKTFLIALPVENLMALIKKDQILLEKKEKNIKKFIEESRTLNLEKNYSIPKLRFIQNSELRLFLDQQVDIWNNSIKNFDNSWWGFQDPTFVKNFGNWIKDWYRKKSSSGIIVRLLSNNGLIEKEMQNFTKINKDQRYINFIDSEDAKFTSTIWIAGDYVILIYTHKKPFYAIEIYSEDLSRNLREVFKILWKKTKKIY